MDLIFDSPKPIFIMFWNWYFFTINTTLLFCFLLDFLVEMMKFLAIFCRNSWHGIWQRRSGLCLKNSGTEIFWKLLQKTKCRLVFKTKFWRKVIIHPYDDENIWNENLLRTSLWPTGFIGHCEDTACETLDLVTENNSCWSKDMKTWFWWTNLS